MKKLLIWLSVTVFILALSACTAMPSDADTATTTTGTTVLIVRDRAIEIALDAAGLSRLEVRDVEAEPEREPGGVFWEVDFEAHGYDYSYDIHAENGTIVKQERKKDN